MERRPNHQLNNMQNPDSIRQSLFATSNNSASRLSNQSSSSSYPPPSRSSSNPYSAANVGRSGGGGGNDRVYAEQSERLLEQQNDALTNHLSSKVDLLKKLSKDISVELTGQLNEIGEMDSDFEKTQFSMKKTITGLANLVNSGGSRHMCYLILFIFGIFILVYFLRR